MLSFYKSSSAAQAFAVADADSPDTGGFLTPAAAGTLGEAGAEPLEAFDKISAMWEVKCRTSDDAPENRPTLLKTGHRIANAKENERKRKPIDNSERKVNAGKGRTLQL